MQTWDNFRKFSEVNSCLFISTHLPFLSGVIVVHPWPAISGLLVILPRVDDVVFITALTRSAQWRLQYNSLIISPLQRQLFLIYHMHHQRPLISLASLYNVHGQLTDLRHSVNFAIIYVQNLADAV